MIPCSLIFYDEQTWNLVNWQVRPVSSKNKSPLTLTSTQSPSSHKPPFSRLMAVTSGGILRSCEQSPDPKFSSQWQVPEFIFWKNMSFYLIIKWKKNTYCLLLFALFNSILSMSKCQRFWEKIVFQIKDYSFYFCWYIFKNSNIQRATLCRTGDPWTIRNDS